MSDDAVMIRPAEASDVPALRSMLNAEIKASTAIYWDAPRSTKDFQDWVDQRRTRNDPILVATPPDSPWIMGYAAYGPWRPQSGFALTVEHSILVHPAARGQGVAKALLEQLIDHAIAANLEVMIGAVDADNVASVRLHEQLGFTEVGRLPGVARKFDRSLDLLFLQKTLANPASNPHSEAVADTTQPD